MRDALKVSVMDGLVPQYAERLLEIILSRGNKLPRSYGFEYEFLPEKVMKAEDMVRLRDLLHLEGYEYRNGVFSNGNRQITFEPGGQIEYLSPPMIASETDVITEMLSWISSMNNLIKEKLNITYTGKGFSPGRYSAPLLLTSDRYTRMHDRFLQCDTRGPEMMKGTAAIHVHAAITSAEDIQKLYPLFCGMASGSELGMSPDRRDIWNRTDLSRCCLPEMRESSSDALSILEDIVRFELQAVELKSGKPYIDLIDRTFEDFLDHKTTIFTDVRLNIKGGTLELRTLDSMPIDRFPEKWKHFAEICEK